MSRPFHLVRSSAGLMHGSRMEIWETLWRVQAANDFRSGWSLTPLAGERAPRTSKPAREVAGHLPAAPMPAALRVLLRHEPSAAGLMRELHSAVHDARQARRRRAAPTQAEVG